MCSFKLVRIRDSHLDPKGVLENLYHASGVLLADMRHVELIPTKLKTELRGFDYGTSIIILNKRTVNGGRVSSISEKRMFPFRALHWNMRDSELMESHEALVKGNYFLCVDSPFHDMPRNNTSSPYTDDGHEKDYHYHCTIKPEEIRWKTKYPAYVNMDRGYDSIGGSSWDGNLVSWFRSGFGTRLQYGIHSGLFPEE